jgi:hypothetical protein
MLANLDYYLQSNKQSCLDLLRLAHNVGDSLNSRCDRFLKAEIIDTAYSRLFPRLKYVDEIGYDFTFFHWKVSQKSQAYVFKNRTKRTNKITISNLHNTSEIEYRIFDYLIITQTARPFSIALADYDVIAENLKKERDSISAEIPYDKLNFIVHPSEDIYFVDTTPINFKKYKNDMIDKMLSMGLLSRTESVGVAV